MTYAEFLKGIGLLTATYNRESSDLMFEAYYLVLKELTPDQWGKAVILALRSSKFMPTPSELYGFAMPPKVKNPEVALKEIRQAFLRYGRNRTPQWSDPAIEEAVEAAGGWNHLCNLTEEQFQRFTVPQIAKIYLSAVGSEVSRVVH